MQEFQAFMSSLSIGSPTSVDGLSVYPLLRTTVPPPFYDTLSDAVRLGTLHISEVSDAGHVPELRVVNDGSRPVLILDGEELVGAKQNRIVNLTVLVPERATITLPVTCVEAGRLASRQRRVRAGRARLLCVGPTEQTRSGLVFDANAQFADGGPVGGVVGNRA